MKTESLMIAYQHISNGGIEYRLDIKSGKNSRDEDKETLFLVIALSNMGVKTETRIPVFKTTAPILEKIAHYIAIRDDSDSTFSYLSAITASIKYPDGGEYMFVPPGEGETEAKAIDPALFHGVAGSKDKE